jgi:hypothetical protein
MQAGFIVDLLSVMVRQPMSVALDENIMDRFVGLVRFAWDT